MKPSSARSFPHDSRIHGFAALAAAFLAFGPNASAQISGTSIHDGGTWEYRFVEDDSSALLESLDRDTDRELLFSDAGRIITGQYLTAGQSRARTMVSVYDTGDLRLLYRVTVPNYVQRAEWSSARNQVFLITTGHLSTRPWIIRPDDIIPALVLVDPASRSIERRKISTSSDLGVTAWRDDTILVEVERGPGISADSHEFTSSAFAGVKVEIRPVNQGIIKGAREVRDGSGLAYLGLTRFPRGWWEAPTVTPNASTASIVDGDHAGTHWVFSSPKGTVVDINLSTLRSRAYRFGTRFVRAPGIFEDGTVHGWEGDEIIFRSDAREMRRSLAPFAEGGVEAAIREGRLTLDFAKSHALVFSQPTQNELEVTALAPGSGEDRRNRIRFPQMISEPKLQPVRETIGLITGNVDEAQHWREIEPFTGKQLGRPLPVFSGGDTFVEQSIGLAPDGWRIVSGTTEGYDEVGYGLTLTNEREGRFIYLGHKSDSIRGLHPLVMQAGSAADGRLLILSSGTSRAELLSVDPRSGESRQVFEWSWNDKNGVPRYSEQKGWFWLPVPSGYSVFAPFGADPAKTIFDLYFRGEGSYAIVLPSGHYAGSPGCESFLMLRDGMGAPVSADLLAPWRNRPAEVLRALGGSADQIAALAATTERWLQRLGIDPTLPEPTAAELPTVAASRPGLFQSSRDVRFSVMVRAGSEDLASVLVRVNGAHDQEWFKADQPLPAGQSDERIVELRLSAGHNWVEIIPTDSSGRMGRSERFRLIHETRDARPRRFVALLGISRYDSLGELHFSTIDARNVGEVLEHKDMTSRQLALFDYEVDRSVLLKLAGFFAEADVDDEICVFLAGHGELDDEFEYRLLPGKNDDRPASEIGISLSELLETMNSSKSRKRLILIDSCHSGLLGEEKELALKGGSPLRVGANDFRSLEELFRLPGLIRGTTILAASRGSEVAWEHADTGGGLFTAAVREAIGQTLADFDQDGRVRVSELWEYLHKRLPQLSVEMEIPELQIPSAVALEPDQDFPLFSGTAPRILETKLSRPTPSTGLPTSSTPASRPAAPPAGTQWVIACEAEDNEAGAKRAAARWAARGFPSGTLWIPAYTSLSGARLWLVYVGPFEDRTSGKAMLPRVRKFYRDAYGIKVDQSGRRETF
jgi:hypothetical protein